jgi:hypothetical protein
LKTAFEEFHSTNNEATYAINLGSRFHNIYWTKDDPHEHGIRSGYVRIVNDRAPLVDVGKEITVVKIGKIMGFPLDGSLLFYCGDNDIVYYLCLEAFKDETQGERWSVFEFRKFSEILKEFV